MFGNKLSISLFRGKAGRPFPAGPAPALGQPVQARALLVGEREREGVVASVERQQFSHILVPAPRECVRESQRERERDIDTGGERESQRERVS